MAVVTRELSPSTSPARRFRLDTADVVLAGALLVQLLPLLLLDRIVTVDGPAHLAGAAVLAGYDDPARQLLRELYVVDLSPVPNLLTSVLLAALLPLTGPDVAERLLLAGYVLLLVLGLRCALRAADPRAGWLAVAAFPFVGSYLLFYGFYNFCLALGLSLFVVGIGLRRRTGWSPAATAGLAGLLLVTWSAHLLPLLVAGLFVAVLSVARALADRQHGTAYAVARHLWGPGLAGLPVLGLTLAFLLSPASERGEPVRLPLLDLVTGLLTLGRPLVTFSRLEYLPATVVAGTLLTVAVLAHRQQRPASPERRALAVTGLVMTLAYFASPARYGAEFGFLNDRLSFFPPLFLLLWAAGPPPGPRARRAVVGALLGAAVTLAALQAPTQVRHSRAVDELLSVAEDVPRGATLLKLQLWRVPVVGPPARNPFRDPLRHAPGRLAVLRDGVDIGHYEAVYDYFPTRFRTTLNPRRLLDPSLQGLSAVPPDVDLTRAAPLVDVVLVVGRPQAPADVLQAPSARRVLGELEAGYRQVAVSERSGLVEVWVRR